MEPAAFSSKRSLNARWGMSRSWGLSPAASGDASQHFNPGVSHSQRVLPLSTQGMVLGDHRPAVREEAGLGFSCINHRLNSECHSWDDLKTLPVSAVMQNLWIFVETPPDPVSAVLSDHRETFGLRIVLDNRTDIP